MMLCPRFHMSDQAPILSIHEDPSEFARLSATSRPESARAKTSRRHGKVGKERAAQLADSYEDIYPLVPPINDYNRRRVRLRASQSARRPLYHHACLRILD